MGLVMRPIMMFYVGDLGSYLFVMLLKGLKFDTERT